MPKLNPAVTDKERKDWEALMKKLEGCSTEFREVFSWMFDVEMYTRAMRLQYQPNPLLAMVRRAKT